MAHFLKWGKWIAECKWGFKSFSESNFARSKGLVGTTCSETGRERKMWPAPDLPSTTATTSFQSQGQKAGARHLTTWPGSHKGQTTLSVEAARLNSAKEQLIHKRLFLFWFLIKIIFSLNLHFLNTRKAGSCVPEVFWKSKLSHYELLFLWQHLLPLAAYVTCSRKDPKGKKCGQSNWIYYERRDYLDFNPRFLITLH